MSENSPFENLYQEELYIIPSRTLIVLDKDWAECTDEEKGLLGKILSSVKLSLAHVQIIRQNDSELNDLLAYNPKRIISFGVQVRPVNNLYQNVPLEGIQVILSDSIGNLDDQKKKNLWLALKQMFGI